MEKIMTLDRKRIDHLRNLSEMIPVIRDSYEPWLVRVFDREEHECRNYLSPNRRDFFKILFVTKGLGLFTMGLNTYSIDKPTILFIHPADIITWKNLTPGEGGGYYVLFRKKFSDEQPMLKAAIDKYGLFTDHKRKVIRLSDERMAAICQLFEKIASVRRKIIAAFMLLPIENPNQPGLIGIPDYRNHLRKIPKMINFLFVQRRHDLFHTPSNLLLL